MVLFHRWLCLLACPPLAWAADCPPLSASSAQALTLAVVEARVAACHPDVRAAELVLRTATADQQTAGQGPNPQLTVGAGSVGRSVGAGALWNKTFDHQLRVDQLIERGGKPMLRRVMAQAQRDASEADYAQVQRQALAATRKAYFDLSAALSRLQETRSAAALADSSRNALQRRAAAGDTAPLDATRFGLEALRLHADLRQAEADVQTQRQQLAQLIGATEPGAADITPVDRLDDFTIAAVGLSDASLPSWRPDVQAASKRVLAAQAARDLARAMRTRDVSVGLQLDRFPVSDANPSGTGNTVSVSLGVPLFMRHAYDGENARAEADVQAAREAELRVSNGARQDAERAWHQWRAAVDRHDIVARELLPAAERVTAGAELAYSKGATSVLDLLDARRSLHVARIELINASADRAKAAADLDAAVPRSPFAPAP